ncbi:MAG TPA: very short patch repair endonuclease [Methylococcus sp.]|nr:very short patch repair endonuclease [Methylococcus sp.]
MRVSILQNDHMGRPAASSYNALRTMQANRRVSALEIRFRRALWSSGIRGYRIHPRLPGSPDLAFPRHKLAVFVHGCFWHQCPKGHLPAPKANAEFWEAKFRENRRRDEAAVNALTAIEWTVMTIWECDLRADMGAAIDSLREAMSR